MTVPSDMSEKIHILHHALGLDKHGRGETYREHFVAGPGHDDYATCMALVTDGLMQRHEKHNLAGGSDLFIVTAAGRAWVKEISGK